MEVLMSFISFNWNATLWIDIKWQADGDLFDNSEWIYARVTLRQVEQVQLSSIGEKSSL